MEELESKAQLEAKRIAAIHAKLRPLPDKPIKKSPWKLIGIIAGLIVLLTCICETGAAVYFTKKMVNNHLEQPEVLAVIDHFMYLMKYNNAEDAYNLFSARQQKITSLQDIEEMLDGDNYLMFEGYWELNLIEFEISIQKSYNLDWPQGTVAYVFCEVLYQKENLQLLEAILEKQDGEWKLADIFVYPPSDNLREANLTNPQHPLSYGRYLILRAR